MLTVLLVDDEPLVLEGLKFMIDWRGHGYRVCGEAFDGVEALEQIRQFNPDLVVTDIRMPALGGMELIGHCARRELGDRKFIILSGAEDFYAAQKALKLGVVDYLLKPINPDDFHRALTKIRQEWVGGTAEAEPDVRERLEAVRSMPSWRTAAECLLAAAEAGDEAEMEAQCRRLCDMLEHRCQSLPEREACLTDLLLELLWQATESAAGLPEEVDLSLSLAFLKEPPPSWPESLLAICRDVSRRLGGQQAAAKPTDEAVRYIREHFHLPLRLQDVAEALYFQPAYFGQLFRKHVGKPFIEYVHHVRIKEACRLLRRTDLKVAEVARHVGYADPELFAEKFKKEMLVSPSQYRK